ncbi:hypothetical protein ACFPOA_09405 [Lysobacter niabensis]
MASFRNALSGDASLATTPGAMGGHRPSAASDWRGGGQPFGECVLLARHGPDEQVGFIPASP